MGFLEVDRTSIFMLISLLGTLFFCGYVVNKILLGLPNNRVFLEDKKTKGSRHLKQLLEFIINNEYPRAFAYMQANIEEIEEFAKFYSHKGEIRTGMGFKEFIYQMAAKDDLMDMLRYTPKRFHFLEVLDKDDWFKYIDTVLTYQQLNGKLDNKEIPKKLTKV